MPAARCGGTLRGIDGFGFGDYIRRLGIVVDMPVDGLATIEEARRTLDRVESLLVAQARAGGASWAEIGDALDLSRQAAHSRHRRRTDDA